MSSNLSAKDIKFIKSLGVKKYRDESGLFVVEGEKMVNEALKSSFEVINVYYKDEIGEEAMSRISSLSTPSPVLAVVRQPESVGKGIFKADKGLYLALDAIRDPGNLGTILRIADWYGINAVIASRDTVDVFNPKVVQSTMGAVFRVAFHYVDLPQVTKQILTDGGKVYGTFLDGENIYERTLSVGNDCASVIVIGNEANGISEQMRSLVSDKLYLPPYPADQPGSESLNAAVATAITVAEFRRRINSL